MGIVNNVRLEQFPTNLVPIDVIPARVVPRPMQLGLDVPFADRDLFQVTPGNANVVLRVKFLPEMAPVSVIFVAQVCKPMPQELVVNSAGPVSMPLLTELVKNAQSEPFPLHLVRIVVTAAIVVLNPMVLELGVDSADQASSHLGLTAA